MIPMFAEFLDGFTIEESLDMGAPSELEVACGICLGTVAALTDGATMKQIMVAVVAHRCDE